jgi:hypothetical protein
MKGRSKPERVVVATAIRCDPKMAHQVAMGSRMYCALPPNHSLAKAEQG